MGKQLIIVESPAKVKTIKKFLGPQYMVQASVGHVRDLPSSSLGVDEANDFAPQYEIIDNKKNVVSELRSAAAKADTVYLAPDPDREGEAIAWHVAELIRDKAKDIKRIQFNEITARAVKEALAHPRELNQHLFDAQQARRVLDRLVGYKISPLLWKTIKRGISAGRVQSVALRLIVEREALRNHFLLLTRAIPAWHTVQVLRAEEAPADEEVRVLAVPHFHVLLGEGREPPTSRYRTIRACPSRLGRYLRYGTFVPWPLARTFPLLAWRRVQTLWVADGR